MANSPGCQGPETQFSLISRNVPDSLDKKGYQLKAVSQGAEGRECGHKSLKCPDVLQLSEQHIILSLSVWPVLVMFLQKSKTNRVCIYRKEIYFKELAHVTVEANPKAVSWQNSSLLERWACGGCSISTSADWARPSCVMEGNLISSDVKLIQKPPWTRWFSGSFRPCDPHWQKEKNSLCMYTQINK